MRDDAFYSEPDSKQVGVSRPGKSRAGKSMVYVGIGGAIEGKVNPDLGFQPGDIVEINLVNGDGVLHDLLNACSPLIGNFM
jgi:hypothetical protein